MPIPDAPGPSSSSTSVPQSAPGSTSARGRGKWFTTRRGLLTWLFFCLFQAGLLGGWFCMWQYGRFWIEEPPETRHSPGAVRSGPPPELGPPPPTLQDKGTTDLGRADELLAEGRYEAAAAIYQPQSEGNGPLAEAVRYRLALCQEELSRWDQALALYREVASRARSPRVVVAAQLAQARVWVRMRKPAEAKRLLCDLILRSADPELREQQQILADARYLLALAMSFEVIRPEPPGPFSEAVVSHKEFDWPVERLLSWVTLAKEVESKKDGGPENRQPLADDNIEVQRLGPKAEDQRIRGSCRQLVVAEFIDRLASLAGLRTNWTPEARHQASVRTAAVAVDSAPLLDVFRALTVPLGLVWRMEGETVHFVSEQESSAEALTTYRAENARRALREAVLAYSDHPFCPVALLELGNLEVAVGNLQQAVAGYERLIRERSRSPVLTEAFYNLGLIQKRLDNLAAARNAFYQVVDRAPSNELAPLAYIKIGRLYLDQGDFEHAVSPLRRGVASAAGSATQPAAVVTLAAAYLLTGNPRAANSCLVEYREEVGREPYRQTAAFLDALAHYRIVTDRRQAQREASGLLAALLSAPDDTVLGPVGMYLLGQAYGELGMVDQMARRYEKALPGAKGPLAAELTLLLAEGQLTSGRRGAAVKLFESLVASEQDPWTSTALLRLGEMALQDKRPEDCLKYCAGYPKDKVKPDAAALLKLMGRAYEQMGDHQQAARCFSGLFPEP